MKNDNGEPYLYTDEGDELVIPWKWEICHTCRGSGTSTLGGIAITGSEWAEWDEDDRIAYRTGAYDGPCVENCDNGKLKEPDEERATPEQLAQYERDLCEEAEYRQIEAMERAYGC